MNPQVEKPEEILNPDEIMGCDIWISVKEELPEENTMVIAYDIDSLTPEKELLFKDGKFLFCAHGTELDYTEFIEKWRPINSDLNEKVLEIALDVVFLKYGQDCEQDEKFNIDCGKVYDFIFSILRDKPEEPQMQ